jgi:hypothetical protein
MHAPSSFFFLAFFFLSISSRYLEGEKIKLKIKPLSHACLSSQKQTKKSIPD